MTTTEDGKRPVVLFDVEKMFPHPKNAKKHSEDQKEKLARSIKKFGVASPPNIKPSGEIITGVGRWSSVREKLGWTKMPVVIRDDLSDAEADALRISDNQTVSTEYDTELLKASMMDLQETDFTDMDALGFDDKELERLTSDFAELSIDDGVFAEDITSAVEDQKAKNTEKEAEVDKSAAPVADALGFKRVTVEQSRKIRECMTAIEGKSGKQGVEALLDVLEKAA